MRVLEASFEALLLSVPPPFFFGLFMAQIFEQKRPWYYLTIYGLIKASVSYILFNVVLGYYFRQEVWYMYLLLLTAGVFTLGVALMLPYVFDGDILKLYLTGSVIDFVAGGISFVAMLAVRAVFPVSSEGWLSQFAGITGIGIFLVSIVLFLIIYRVMQPVFRRWQDHEIRWRKIGTCVVILGFSSGLSTYIPNPYDNAMNHGIYIVVSIVGIFILVLSALLYFGLFYRKKVSMEQDYLHQQINMMKVQYNMAQKQIRQMEKYQEQIDKDMADLMQEIEKKNQDFRIDERVDHYLENLVDQYKSITAGVFCDDWVLDSILSYYAAMYEKLQVQTDFLAQEYIAVPKKSDQLYEIIIQLLDWGMSGHVNDTSQVSSIRLHIATSANRIMLEYGEMNGVSWTERIKRKYRMKRMGGEIIFLKSSKRKGSKSEEKSGCNGGEASFTIGIMV